MGNQYPPGCLGFFLLYNFSQFIEKCGAEGGKSPKGYSPFNRFPVSHFTYQYHPSLNTMFVLVLNINIKLIVTFSTITILKTSLSGFRKEKIIFDFDVFGLQRLRL